MNFNSIIRYFDLQSSNRTTDAKAQGKSGGGRAAPIWPQYIALVLGIVVQPYLHFYVQQGQWSLAFGEVWGRMLFGVIIGALAFPAVYKDAFDPNKPEFIQLCAIFAAGIGWQSVIQGGAKAALGV